MKIIWIKGGFVWVDDEDYERVSSLNWRLLERQGCRYAVRNDSPNEMVFMHRFILNLPRSPRGNTFVDHINRNGLDNRKANLRFANNHQNQGNKAGVKNTSSRFRGVTWSKQSRKWQAYINNGKGTSYLGLFIDEDAAARAYDEAALTVFGDFAYLNFPTREQLEHRRQELIDIAEGLRNEIDALDSQLRREL